MNRKLLQEAIADAKTVKETAIENARLALEETFSPKLREMFAEKMNSLDNEDSLSENSSEETDQDDLNLDEILAELEEIENGDSKTEEETALDEIISEEEEEVETETSEEETETPGDDETSEEEEDFDINNMEEEDLKAFIESVVDEMIASGELESDGTETSELPNMDDEMPLGDESETEVEDEETVNIDELLAEIMNGEDLNEEEVTEGAGEAIDQFLASAEAGKAAAAIAALLVSGVIGGAFKDDIKKGLEMLKTKLKGDGAQEELKEAYKTIGILKTEMSETNLLNAKLLYTNKIFKSKTLNENQKVKVLSTFDKASSVKEVKLVYETLLSGLNEKKKSQIKESLGFASKTASTRNSKIGDQIIPEDSTVARFKKLAGLS